MSTFDRIDDIVKGSRERITQKTRLHRVQLYAEGLKAKIRQTDFALSCIATFSDQSDSTISSTSKDDYTITDKVYFYCDVFWTFLYSSLDVLAQIVNQALKLDLKERDVSFKQVKSILDTKCSNTQIQKKFSQCMNSNVFKNLDKYRNCSTHRRQICIFEDIREQRITSGYRTTTTGIQDKVIRIICDDPFALSPRTDQKRKIPDYMEDTKEKILTHIERILKAI